MLENVGTIKITIIIIMWLVHWTLPFPRAKFALDDRQLPEQI